MVKLHERKFISCDPEKCVGCQTCEYACSFGKEKAFSAVKSRIRVVREGQIRNIAVTCRFCQDPALRVHVMRFHNLKTSATLFWIRKNVMVADGALKLVTTAPWRCILKQKQFLSVTYVSIDLMVLSVLSGVLKKLLLS